MGANGDMIDVDHVVRSGNGTSCSIRHDGPRSSSSSAVHRSASAPIRHDTDPSTDVAAAQARHGKAPSPKPSRNGVHQDAIGRPPIASHSAPAPKTVPIRSVMVPIATSQVLRWRTNAQVSRRALRLATIPARCVRRC